MSSIPCNADRISTLQNSNFLHFSQIFMVLLSLLAIPIVTWALYKCVTTKFFHVNIRLIGGFHCLCLLIHCGGRVYQHSASLVFWLSDSQICEKQHSLSTCLISHSMYNFGMYSSGISSILMVIERTIATLYSALYQNQKWHIGAVLISLQFLASLAITAKFSLNSDYGDRAAYCFSDNQLEFALFCKISMIFLNIFALVQCFRLARINKKLRVDEEVKNLTQKFQVEENKTLIKVMIRFTSMDFVFMVAFFFLGFLVQIWSKNVSEPTFLASFELIHCVPLYSIVVLVCMAITIKNIQKERTRQSSEEVQIKDAEYFVFFKKQWA